MKTNKITDLKKELGNSEVLKTEFLNNPIEFIQNIEVEEPIKNKTVFLTIIGIVGAVLLASIILGGIIIFKSNDLNSAKVPEFLVSIGSTALGGLVGLLAPSPSS